MNNKFSVQWRNANGKLSKLNVLLKRIGLLITYILMKSSFSEISFKELTQWGSYNTRKLEFAGDFESADKEEIQNALDKAKLSLEHEEKRRNRIYEKAKSFIGVTSFLITISLAIYSQVAWHGYSNYLFFAFLILTMFTLWLALSVIAIIPTSVPYFLVEESQRRTETQEIEQVVKLTINDACKNKDYLKDLLTSVEYNQDKTNYLASFLFCIHRYFTLSFIIIIILFIHYGINTKQENKAKNTMIIEYDTLQIMKPVKTKTTHPNTKRQNQQKPDNLLVPLYFSYG